MKQYRIQSDGVKFTPQFKWGPFWFNIYWGSSESPSCRLHSIEEAELVIASCKAQERIREETATRKHKWITVKTM